MRVLLLADCSQQPPIVVALKPPPPTFTGIFCCFYGSFSNGVVGSVSVRLYECWNYTPHAYFVDFARFGNVLQHCMLTGIFVVVAAVVVFGIKVGWYVCPVFRFFVC